MLSDKILNQMKLSPLEKRVLRLEQVLFSIYNETASETTMALRGFYEVQYEFFYNALQSRLTASEARSLNLKELGVTLSTQ